MELEILLQQAGRGEYVPMEAGDYSPSDAYWYGELIAETASWRPDLDLHGLLSHRCGGTIHYIDYAAFRRHPNIFANSIYFRGASDFDVVLPAYARMVENRFTLAHELGHYVLHAQRSGKSYAQRNGTGIVEQQADCFALGFLMPSEQFRRAAAQYKTVTELSLVFRVPEFAIQTRLQSLDIESGSSIAGSQRSIDVPTNCLF